MRRRAQYGGRGPCSVTFNEFDWLQHINDARAMVGPGELASSSINGSAKFSCELYGRFYFKCAVSSTPRVSITLKEHKPGEIVSFAFELIRYVCGEGLFAVLEQAE
jgi:hypothetical protein